MQLSLFQTVPAPPKPVVTPYEEKVRAVLERKLPAAALDGVVQQIAEHPVGLIIVPHRTSKSGDFRPAQRNQPPRITVNGNLNPYSFLLTLLHELAHHHVHLEHLAKQKKFTLRRKRKPLPHGAEWKEKFRQLMAPWINEAVFPPDLLPVLVRSFDNPKASSSAEHKLSKALNRYDPPDDTVRLEELPFDAVFSLHGRRLFRKQERIRTRYRCICMQTKRIYLVSAGAPVVRVTGEVKGKT